MERIFQKITSKKPIDPFLTNTDALGSNPAWTSTDPMRLVPASAATASLRVIQAAGVTTNHQTAHKLEVSASVLAPADRLEENRNKPCSPNPVIQHSGSGFFANAQNFCITGGTFNNVSILPANTGEGKMKIPVSQKPNPSPLFTGWKDVLHILGNIFVHHPHNRPRCSCLLWGMGGIGKTQICLKFTEEMSDIFSHVFWVDASSEESITMSLKGISNISAAQASGVGDSVECVLQWISGIQGEWLIVLDNADDPPPEVVAKFIPPGNRGNILITS